MKEASSFAEFCSRSLTFKPPLPQASCTRKQQDSQLIRQRYPQEFPSAAQETTQTVDEQRTSLCSSTLDSSSSYGIHDLGHLGDLELPWTSTTRSVASSVPKAPQCLEASGYLNFSQAIVPFYNGSSILPCIGNTSAVAYINRQGSPDPSPFGVFQETFSYLHSLGSLPFRQYVSKAKRTYGQTPYPGTGLPPNSLIPLPQISD